MKTIIILATFVTSVAACAVDRYWDDLPSVVDARGHASFDHKHCPLDPAFQADCAARIKSVAAAAHPPFINIEDDYTLAHSRGLTGGACFCKRHLADFAVRYGKPLTGPEIDAAFKIRTDANLQIRKAWADTIRESLVALARRRSWTSSSTTTSSTRLRQGYGGQAAGATSSPRPKVWHNHYGDEI